MLDILSVGKCFISPLYFYIWIHLYITCIFHTFHKYIKILQISNSQFTKVILFTAHDDRVVRPGVGPYIGGNRLRVSFKTQRPNKEMRRNLNLANLDEDIPMTMGSNNNARQIIIRERGRGGCSRGRNSPLPSRFQGGQPTGSRLRQPRLGESDWYKICVSIIYIHFI